MHMEKGPKPMLESEMTVAEIDAEIARLSKEVIDIQDNLGNVTAESGGNSLDDQAQEETAKDQVTGPQIEEIASIRERIRELEDEKRRKKAAA